MLICGQFFLILTETTWGTLPNAMRLAYLDDRAAIHIAAQIHSALHYMRKSQLCHGGVDVSNVVLLHAPRIDPIIAKLTNFIGASFADTNSGDITSGSLSKDFTAFAVFTSTLFVNDHDTYFALRSNPGTDRFMSGVKAVQDQIVAKFPRLGLLLRNIASRDFIPEREIDECMDDFYKLFGDADAELRKDSLKYQAERSAVQEAWMHALVKL